MMLSEVKRIKIKSNEIERQLEKFFSSLLVCGAEAGWRNALLSWESWILEGRRVHAGCTCCFNYSLTWWFRTLRWTCSLRLASASLFLSLSRLVSLLFSNWREMSVRFSLANLLICLLREKKERKWTHLLDTVRVDTLTLAKRERERERERESTTAPDGRWRSTTRARDTWPPVLYTEGFSRSLLLPVVLSALFFSFLCYLCVYESPVLARDILCAAPGPIVPASGVPPRVSPPFSSFYPLLLLVFSYFVLFSPWSLALWPRRCLPLSSGSVQLNSAAQKNDDV